MALPVDIFTSFHISEWACIYCFLPLSDRVNNFPPLPKILRIKPCFYQNIDDEIPAPHQQLVRRVYTLWMCESFIAYSFIFPRRPPLKRDGSRYLLSSLSAVYSGTLCMNVISCIAWWAGGGSATNFGFSLLWLLLFSPCSYTCWFRPLYKAFRLVLHQSHSHSWMMGSVHRHAVLVPLKSTDTLSWGSGTRDIVEKWINPTTSVHRSGHCHFSLTSSSDMLAQCQWCQTPPTPNTLLISVNNRSILQFF